MILVPVEAARSIRNVVGSEIGGREKFKIQIAKWKMKKMQDAGCRIQDAGYRSIE